MTPDPQAAGKCVWQISEMKKHFWILGACLVYLPCLWVALSSVFLPNWILCTQSHRSILHLLTRAAHLPFSHMRHICLHVFTALCFLWFFSLYNNSKSFALTCICIFPPLTLSPRPLFKHQKGFGMENMCFHLNKPSKTVLQTLDPGNYFHAQMLLIIL